MEAETEVKAKGKTARAKGKTAREMVIKKGSGTNPIHQVNAVITITDGLRTRGSVCPLSPAP